MAVDAPVWAAALFEAAAKGQPIQPITATVPGLTVDDGYRVQEALVALHVGAGARVVGAKLGLTSRAKQEQMGVSDPVFGVLLSGGLHPPGEPLRAGELIHPRAEPEIVFLMGERLAGPGVGVGEVLAATRAVACGLEVIDSRYVDFRFTLPDVVADNTSAARVVVGPEVALPAGLDLAGLEVQLLVDGQVVAEATGAAVLGHPALSVATLANRLGAAGSAIEPGWVVFSGGMTEAVPLRPGSTVAATCAELGSVSVTVE